MKRNSRKVSNAGFTLIETMIIVVIIGVIAGITIPTFMNYFQRQKVVGVERELMADIAYARSLAIARRSTFRLVINGNDYQIIDPANGGAVVRMRTMPDGITLAKTADPQFYPHGLADAANITIDGTYTDNIIQVLPNGTAQHM